MSSPLDLVIYGATGFTGSQAAHYIARRVAPGTLRWAIAGRSQPKLDALAALSLIHISEPTRPY